MTPFNKEILRLAVPSILASITVPIVGMVDLAVAGHLDGLAIRLVGRIVHQTLYHIIAILCIWKNNIASVDIDRNGLPTSRFVACSSAVLTLICVL